MKITIEEIQKRKDQMQIVQKLYIEIQEMMPDMKIKKGHFWFNGQKYEIENGTIKTTENACEEIR